MGTGTNSASYVEYVLSTDFKWTMNTPQHLVPNLRMKAAALANPQNAFIATKETTLV